MDESVESRSYALQARVAFMGLGDDPATANFYEGDTLLAIVPLAEPLGTVVDGALVLAVSPEALILVSGTANLCVFRNGAGTRAWTSPVSDLEGNGEVKIESTTLYAGGYTRLIGGVLA